MSDAMPAEIERLKGTHEYAANRVILKDRNWRIDNLYTIVTESGQEVKFCRNEAQRAYMAKRWSRDIIVKARKLGFSTLIDLLIADACFFRSNITAAIVDKSLDDAEKKLQMIELAYRRLRPDLAKANPCIKSNTEEMVFSNGSRVSVGTSARGGTPQILHVSEYGRISVDKPDAAREIQNGSIQAVPATGWVALESTAHGRAGRFYEMATRADAKLKEGALLTAKDFRLHFYGWWLKPEYRLPNNLVVVSQELREYFGEMNAKLRLRGFAPLDADQQAWYAQTRGDLGPDDTFEEFPTIYEECFFNSVLGSFWKKEISRAREDKRIGLPVPYDNTRRVNTMWDIGEDCTAIIFYQTDGVRFRVIDYFEEEGGSIQAAATVLEDKRRDRGFVYDKHIGPHDLEHRDWANNAQTRKKTASDLGIKFEVVDQVLDKADSIDAGRRLLNMAWIDSVHCGLLVERFENYRKRWNKALQVFSAEPVHDMPSHGSDAWQQGAMWHTPDKFARGENRPDRSRPRDSKPARSPWAS